MSVGKEKICHHGAGAAAGVAVAYLALRNRATMVGCVEASSDGTKVMNEKNQKTYALIASNDVVLSPGERVALKGKKATDDAGKLSFEVHMFKSDKVKDLRDNWIPKPR